MPFASRVRAYLNHYLTRCLPPFMHLTYNSKHVPVLQCVTGPRHISIIPEGYEDLVGSRSQENARRAAGLPLTKRIVLLFGVASKAKGSDLLLDAMKEVPPTFRVCIVGQTGGVYQSSWGPVDELKHKGWKDELHVVDRYVSDEEMANYYAACDAVVIPYRNGFAATSTHLRRASDYGKAIIGCDQYLIGDTVRDYHLGLLFQPEDVEDLRRRLLEFAQKPQVWFDQIRENSARLAKEQSWENVGRMYRTLFEEIVAGPDHISCGSRKPATP